MTSDYTAPSSVDNTSIKTLDWARVVTEESEYGPVEATLYPDWVKIDSQPENEFIESDVWIPACRIERIEDE